MYVVYVGTCFVLRRCKYYVLGIPPFLSWYPDCNLLSDIVTTCFGASCYNICGLIVTTDFASISKDRKLYPVPGCRPGSAVTGLGVRDEGSADGS